MHMVGVSQNPLCSVFICSFAVCLSDAFVQLNLLVSFGLLAVIICLSIYIVNPDQSTFGILVQDMHINLTGQKQVSVIEIVGSAFAGNLQVLV